MLRIVPMTIVMGTIFYLSSQPGETLNLPDVPDLDKILHGIAYGVLAGTVLFAVPEQTYQKKSLQVSLLVVLFCLAYGISDEFHQSFVPDRTPSGLDLIADTAGAVIMVGIWPWLKKRFHWVGV